VIKSKEYIQQILFFIDVLELDFTLLELFNVVFYVFLGLTLHWQKHLAGLFAKSLRILNRDNVGGFEALGDQVIHHCFSIWKLNMIVILNSLGNGSNF